MSGQGKYTFVNNYVFEGQFENENMKDKGKLTDPNGK